MIHPIANSSLIDSLERTEDGVTRVTFKSTGAIYEYHGIPQDVFGQWIQSDSAGKFYNANIKGNKEYESKKL